MTAGFLEDEVGGVGEPEGLLLQGVGIEKARRHAEMIGQRMDRRFRRLQGDRENRGYRGLGQAMFGEEAFREIDQLRPTATGRGSR